MQNAMEIQQWTALTLRVPVVCMICVVISCILVNKVNGSTQSGPCYSNAQYVCRNEMTELWVAVSDRQYQKACQNLGPLHTCIQNYMSQCRFTEEEAALYQKDIVEFYKKAPYRCQVIGGNLKYRGEQMESSAPPRPRGHWWTTAPAALLALFVWIHSRHK